MTAPPPDVESRRRAGDAETSELEYIHASAVVVGEAGMLIKGASGAGKSSLALALIATAQNAGSFARLVGDDRIRLENRGGRLIARAHPRIFGQIERRGQGLLSLPFLASAVLRVVIDLAPAAELGPRYPEQDDDVVVLAGAELPRLRLSQDRPASDLASTVLQLFNLLWKS
ncbi:HPr kinase/phosphorylase [Methylocapsa acidiphila]|uniref:HPr kinase/phosphorylase n=1 Tax=Methylocapsa acidiphila TaxID=133552 RepID=UPI0003FE1B6B|nr:HPr kinase/phosphatase C-terminal domain-containing protein [Methylocapsa acidiphila]